MDIARLRTRRLDLVPLGPQHSAGMFALWSAPEVCRYAGPVSDYEGNAVPLPATDASASDRILDFWLRASSDGWGFRWAVTGRADGQFIGTAGFNSLGACSEYAYHLIPAHWGHGYMTEASEAAFRWIGETGLCQELELFIEPENHRSIALAERLGFSAERDGRDGALRFTKVLANGPRDEIPARW